MEQTPHKDEFKRDIKIYFAIIALIAMILIIHHLNLGVWGIAIIVTIAIGEASILGYFFMHLMTKKKTVHLVLLLTVIVFLTLLFWPAWDVFYSPRTPSEFTSY
jgi:caa(3)-type oxidase subunit IV